MLFALPLGFGAGAIDTALNNYVALHYKSHHMNWLHSFWGVGASTGPLIMSFYLLSDNWRDGFLTIAGIQFLLMLIITLSLPLWKQQDDLHEEEVQKKPVSIWRIKGIQYALLIFLVYCAIEFSVGVWGSSYLVYSKNIAVSSAATIVTIYYLGITFGRFLSGGLSFFLSNKNLIYGGIFVVLLGGTLLFLAQGTVLTTIAFAVLGMGLAPIFRSMIHETPSNFGKENSQYVIGYQIAFAYIGSAIFPSFFGILYSHISTSLFPLTIFILSIALLLLVVLLAITVRKSKNI
jgi:fucose permease